MEYSFASHVLERNGCPLHYWLAGPEDAPLVVLTHGLCVDHRSWSKTAPLLAQNYRVLMWDVRGHGLSQPVGTRFTVPLAVDDLLTLMNLHGRKKAVLVGHSNGSYIHQELAFRHPERVIAQVVADGTCITWEHSAFERWITKVSPAIMNLFPYQTLLKASLPYASGKKEVQEYAYQAYSMLSKQDYISLMAGMTQCLHSEPDYRIQHPLLLVHGDQDAMGDIVKIMPRWAEREPNCEYAVIPDAYHFAILDNPKVFNDVLIKFLSRWVNGKQ